jgi:FkbM family methyltransferase
MFGRTAVLCFSLLKWVGLERLAFSKPARWLGNRLFVRPMSEPETRAIASGLGKGLLLRLLPSSPQSYWMGIHEPAFQRAVESLVVPEMTVYDCGANIGYFSVMFARLAGPGGRVYAFEPAAQNVVCLRAAASLNGFTQLSVQPYAVWKETTSLRFATAVAGASVSDHVVGSFGEEQAKEESVVSAVSLDDFVYRDGHPVPDLIKIDVEGAETEALLGARRILEERRPTLLLEIHGHPGRGVWALLKPLNYRFVDIATGTVPSSVDEFAVWIRQYVATPE